VATLTTPLRRESTEPRRSRSGATSNTLPHGQGSARSSASARWTSIVSNYLDRGTEIPEPNAAIPGIVTGR